MASLREALKTTLEADGSLMALLTGGVFDADDVFGREGIDSVNAPYEADEVTLKPFAAIRWGGSNPTGPSVIQAAMESVTIYVYQHQGYATIDAALSRIKALLNHQFVTADDRQLAYFMTPQKGPEFAEEALMWAPGRFIRFGVTHIEA